MWQLASYVTIRVLENSNLLHNNFRFRIFFLTCQKKNKKKDNGNNLCTTRASRNFLLLANKDNIVSPQKYNHFQIHIYIEMFPHDFNQMVSVGRFCSFSLKRVFVEKVHKWNRYLLYIIMSRTMNKQTNENESPKSMRNRQQNAWIKTYTHYGKSSSNRILWTCSTYILPHKIQFIHILIKRISILNPFWNIFPNKFHFKNAIQVCWVIMTLTTCSKSVFAWIGIGDFFTSFGIVRILFAILFFGFTFLFDYSFYFTFQRFLIYSNIFSNFASEFYKL